MAVDAGTAYVKVKADTSAAGAAGVRSSFGKIAGLATKAFVGVFAAKKIFDFGASAVKAAEDAQRSTKAFNAALERTGQLGSVNEVKFNKWLQSMGESIGQDDENLRDLATTVVSAFDFSKFGPKATDVLMRVSRGIQDVAAATQKSTGLIKRMFLSILNDPGAAIKQVLKLGAITQGQAEHFKAMVKNGEQARVAQELLNAVTDHYKGAAAAATTAGDKFKAVWENFKELLGGFLLPLFTRFVDGLSKVVHFLTLLIHGNKRASHEVKTFGGVLKALAPVISFVRQIIADQVANWHKLVQVIRDKVWPTLEKLASGPFGKLIRAIAVFAGWILHITLKLVPPMLTVFGVVFSAIGVILNKAATAIVTLINVVIHGLNALIRASNLVLRTHFSTIDTISLGGVEITGAGRGGGRSHTEVRHGQFGLASGGIVNRPTNILAGEAGPEAIIPLGRGGMTLRIVDSNLDLVMTGVLEDDKAFADRGGRSRR